MRISAISSVRTGAPATVRPRRTGVTSCPCGGVPSSRPPDPVSSRLGWPFGPRGRCRIRSRSRERSPTTPLEGCAEPGCGPPRSRPCDRRRTPPPRPRARGTLPPGCRATAVTSRARVARRASAYAPPLGALRRRAGTDPCGAARRGSLDRLAFASGAGSRAPSRGGGCSVGTSACPSPWPEDPRFDGTAGVRRPSIEVYGPVIIAGQDP
jgi:hypothetical protein